MAFQYINTGTSANAGDGDSLRLAFQKINHNFQQVATGSTSTVSITNENDVQLIDIKAYANSFTLPIDTITAITLFEIDTRVYRSAVIDIFAEDETALTQDAGGGFLVTWNSSTSHVLGTGVVSLHQNGDRTSANWNINDTSLYNHQLRVQAYNISGTTSESTINWRAKVSLFRL
jgi:hypothetical protein